MNTKQPVGQARGSQMRITEEEINLIRSTFKNNESLLKLMRKMFLPELDPKAPFGQMIDIYHTIQTKDRNPEDIAVELMARNMVIDHTDNVLTQLWILSMSEETIAAEVVAKAKQDSAK